MTQESDIVHIKLINGQELIARLVEKNEFNHVLEFPMKVEHKQDQHGSPAINLTRYLPFTSLQQQCIEIHNVHIITLTTTSENFAKYFHNSVEFQLTYVQPSTDANIEQINQSLSNVLSRDNQHFLDAMNKYMHRIPNELSTKMH